MSAREGYTATPVAPTSPATTASAVTRRSACSPHCDQCATTFVHPSSTLIVAHAARADQQAYGHDERGAGNALEHLTNGRAALRAVEICPATRRRTTRATRIEQDDEAVQTVSREAQPSPSETALRPDGAPRAASRPHSRAVASPRLRQRSASPLARADSTRGHSATARTRPPPRRTPDSRRSW